MSDLNNVYAVKLGTNADGSPRYVPLHPTRPYAPEPKLWRSRKPAEAELQRWIENVYRTTDSTAAVVEFELREVQK